MTALVIAIIGLALNLSLLRIAYVLTEIRNAIKRQP